MRLDHDEIGDPSDPSQALYGPFCISLLEGVFDFALERHPAFTHRHGHGSRRNSGIPLERSERGSGHVLVGAFGSTGQAHLDVVDDRLDPTHAVSGLFGVNLFQVRIDPAGQRDDAILDRDTDFVGLDSRIPLQFFQDISLDFFICTGANRHVACLLFILCGLNALALPGA